MARPLRALIDLAALASNLKRVRESSAGAKVMAVVKADAYGHGIASAVSALGEADAFAVSSIEEALALRRITAKPIVLLEGFFTQDELPLIREHGFQVVLHSTEQLQRVMASKIAGIKVWVKVDTGMHRLGFEPDKIPEVLRQLEHGQNRVHVLGLMTHFGRADELESLATLEQARCFESLGRQDLLFSMANSAGILAWPTAQKGWLRPGLMLYGASPFTDRVGADLGLTPVMTLASELISVRNCSEGDSVGYGGDWICPRNMRIGVVAAGYGDGYPRHAKPGTPMLVRGGFAPLVGRVCMDMLMVDLSAHPNASVGDLVTLWGPDLPVEVVAGYASTIPNNLLAGISKRVPRLTINNENISLNLKELAQ